MQDPLMHHMAHAIDREDLVPRGARVVIGVSGGPDSVVLAHVLTQLAPRWGLRLVLAHVNYGLRGAAADRDEAFVRAFAEQLGWKCFVKRVQQEAGGKRHEAGNRKRERGNLQAWARDVRYRFFAHVAGRVGARAVAVAHHQDDQAETVLMHLIRGAGVGGLAGMAPKRALDNRLHLIRPLLGIPREVLLRYAERHRLRYRRDVTNRGLRYQRNRVRHQLLPLLTALNPRAIEHLSAAADRLREAEAVLATLAEVAWRRCRVQVKRRRVECDRRPLLPLPPVIRRRVLQRAYGLLRGSANGLQADHIAHMEAIAAGEGTRYGLPGPIVIERQKENIIFRPGRP